MTLAFVFPGQGSQSVGMLAALAAAEPLVQQTFAEASEVLGYDLWELCQKRSRGRPGCDRAHAARDAGGRCRDLARLARARRAAARSHGGPQPGRVHRARLFRVRSISATAVDLVRFRGQVMQAAVPARQGAMAAILGLDDAEIEAACREAAQGEVVEPVNFNAPGQVVVAGHKTAVERAIEAAKARGAKRAVLLPVSVPSHSSLMRGAADKLAARLSQTPLRMPDVPAVYTVDVRTHESEEGIRRALKEQLFSPVRWADTVRAMIAKGATTLIECGPGKVLTALNRRVERRPDLTMLAIDDPAIARRRTCDLPGEGTCLEKRTSARHRRIARHRTRDRARARRAGRAVVGTATSASGAHGDRRVPRCGRTRRSRRRARRREAAIR